MPAQIETFISKQINLHAEFLCNNMKHNNYYIEVSGTNGSQFVRFITMVITFWLESY